MSNQVYSQADVKNLLREYGYLTEQEILQLTKKKLMIIFQTKL